jgi:hypothetical protein
MYRSGPKYPVGSTSSQTTCVNSALGLSALPRKRCRARSAARHSADRSATTAGAHAITVCPVRSPLSRWSRHLDSRNRQTEPTSSRSRKALPGNSSGNGDRPVPVLVPVLVAWHRRCSAAHCHRRRTALPGHHSIVPRTLALDMEKAATVRSRFDAAHELAHLVLHEATDTGQHETAKLPIRLPIYCSGSGFTGRTPWTSHPT